ncbi:MAG: tetratricopeptide repeat protein [Bacteroidota bacterium]
MRYLLIFFLSFCSLSLHAQTDTDQQLALHYYNNGEFDKALSYYDRIFAKDPSKFNFNRLYDCYMATNQYKEAEKLLKKQVAANRFDVDYKVMLGQFYEAQKEDDKANEIYADLIQNLTANPSEIVNLFNSFRGKGKNDLAFQTIEKGRKLLKQSYPLHFQFAEYYGATSQTEKMIGEYLDLLDFNEGYQLTIQNMISRQFDLSDENSKEYTLLKTALLERTQKKVEAVIYPEMLIWLFLQKNNFSAALTQAQALDKRLDERGRRVFDLGQICLENGDFLAGKKAFQYVISLGETSNFYYHAQNALLHAQFLEITTSRSFTAAEIQEAIALYEEKLAQLGKKRSTLPLIIELSHVQAYYANASDKAIVNLSEALTFPGLTDMQRAEVKMKLADIHVLHGDIWEASLLYMQIDGDFKFESIGHEAKFKNAKIFYYDGEFDFAQSQLSVLKQSTTKLIANDALKLSIMITDNYGLDSNYQAMLWFAQGDLLVEQHQFEQAFILFDSITKVYPYHSLGDEILIKKSEAMNSQAKWSESIAFLEELLKYYGTDILVDDALFQLGDIYENKLFDKEKAQEFYQKILFDHKGSLYGDEVRKRYRAIKDETESSEDI